MENFKYQDTITAKYFIKKLNLN